MALLWLIACAFVLPLPMVSIVLFAFAGILGFAEAGEFPDLGMWGGISLALALLSFFGWRGKRKEARERREELARQANHDKMLEDMMRRQS